MLGFILGKKVNEGICFISKLVKYFANLIPVLDCKWTLVKKN